MRYIKKNMSMKSGKICILQRIIKILNKIDKSEAFVDSNH